MKHRWIKFRYLPASWGLVGAAYDEAEAHYSLTGEALERRLIVIRHPFEDHPDVNRKMNLDLDLKYGKIDEYLYDKILNNLTYEYDPQTARLNLLDVEVRHGRMSQYDADIVKAKARYEDVELELALLGIEYDHGRISRSEYEKQRATLKNEPWVAFVDSGFDPEQGIDGVFFELDWNLQWVDFLKLHGFTGKSDEQIVDDWFTEVCRSYGQTGTTTITQSGLSAYPMGYSREE